MIRFPSVRLSSSFHFHSNFLVLESGITYDKIVGNRDIRLTRTIATMIDREVNIAEITILIPLLDTIIMIVGHIMISHVLRIQTAIPLESLGFPPLRTINSS